jgi:1-acyl-sn-glycerol-3-phosphate acyltransferase
MIGLIIPFLIISKIAPHWCYSFAVGWGRSVISSLFLKKTFQGFENIPDGPVIIASNHTSMLDIHLTLGYFPKKFHFLMKEELFKIPFLGTAAAVLGFYPVNRSNPRRAVELLNKVVDHIKNEGASILIYPEGTRNRSDELLPFKNGMAKLAAAAQVPILPIVVTGCKEVNPSIKKLFHYRPISIRVGKPVPPPATERKEDILQTTEIVRQAMIHLLEK